MGIRLDVFAGEEPRVRAVVKELAASHDDAWSALRDLERATIARMEHVFRGERRWWIAGLIEWARASRCFPTTDLEQIEGALAALVGAHGLGELRVARSLETSLGVPWDVSDCHVTFWDTTIVHRVAEAGELLSSSDIAPPPRPDRVGIAPDDGEPWVAWVRDCTARLTVVADGHLREPAILSFCG